MYLCILVLLYVFRLVYKINQIIINNIFIQIFYSAVPMTDIPDHQPICVPVKKLLKYEETFNFTCM